MRASSTASAIDYREVPPPERLAPWVACAWSMRGTCRGVSHRVLPDGCVDLIVDAGDARMDTRLVGPMTTAALVPLDGACDVVGVRFRPGGLVLLSSVPADALLDVDVDPRDVLAQDVLRQLDRACGQDVCGSSPQERIARLWTALGAAANAGRQRDPLLQVLLHRWAGSPRAGEEELLPVRAIARDAGVSERTLERRVRAAAGFRPAELRRLVRFRRALRLHDAGVTDWAVLAADAGFADQPHLVREFRRFAGVTPAAWQAERVGFVQDGRTAAL